MPTAANLDAQIDISDCEREPIRTPGAVQPHGILLVLHPAGLRVVQASNNVTQLIDRVDPAFTTQSFEAWAGDENRDILEKCLANEAVDGGPLHFRSFGKAAGLLGTVHRSDGLVILELEDDKEHGSGAGDLLRVSGAITRLEQIKSVSALCNAVVDEMYALCGFDRVMMYRFDEDWHGEVVAERVVPFVDSFLGLHYPASDIPSQARELYRTNWLRYIPDVAYKPVPLVRFDHVADTTPLDLSNAYLRSVSPVHIEYLQNMGVAATLTVSLLQNGKLWGLIAMHNQRPKTLPYETRAAAELFGRIVSLQLAALAENEASHSRLRTEDVRNRLVTKLANDPTDIKVLGGTSLDLLELVHADGAAIIVDRSVNVLGDAEAPELLLQIADWILATVHKDIFTTNSLALLEPQFESAALASGVMMLTLSREPVRAILFFRHEACRSISWAGKPSEPLSKETSRERLRPRTSFERWNEIQRFRAKPWTPGEIEVAGELNLLIMSVMARRTSELEHVNAQLSRSNRELDEFAHIASHDLKEPLRGIHNYASYLMEDYADVLDEEGRDKLNTLVRLTQRMDHLIESLLQLSRFGRVDFEENVTELDATVEEVIELFGPRIEGRKAHVSVASHFPAVQADPSRVAEVFNNLLSNALKYSERAEPQISIGYLPPSTDDARVTFFVKDNGIGIPQRHLRTVFQMFKRLHPTDHYGGGTGAGLAIALRIIERHQGIMWIESQIGEGTTVYFTLQKARK